MPSLGYVGGTPTLVYAPSHHPGYTDHPTDTAHGYPRTAGECSLTALRRGVTERTVSDGVVTVCHCSARYCPSLFGTLLSVFGWVWPTVRLRVGMAHCPSSVCGMLLSVLGVWYVTVRPRVGMGLLPSSGGYRPPPVLGCYSRSRVLFPFPGVKRVLFLRGF